MKDKIKKLRDPLTINDIELRVGNVSKMGASYLLYKTARTDAKRLDDVFGANWKREHRFDEQGNNVCKISIYNEELKEWVSREDVGTESYTEKVKGSYSDSFKRAGTSWGIGAELYEAPFIFVKLDTKPNSNGKYEIDRSTKVALKDIEIINGAIKKVIITVNGKDQVIKNIDFDFEEEADTEKELEILRATLREDLQHYIKINPEYTVERFEAKNGLIEDLDAKNCRDKSKKIKEEIKKNRRNKIKYIIK